MVIDMLHEPDENDTGQDFARDVQQEYPTVVVAD